MDRQTSGKRTLGQFHCSSSADLGARSRPSSPLPPVEGKCPVPRPEDRLPSLKVPPGDSQLVAQLLLKTRGSS